MLHEPYTILVLLFFTMVLFIWGYWRYDVVALLALAIAVLIGAVPFKQIYSGLNNPAVITIACVMVISKAIHYSGSVSFLVTKISRVSKYPSLHIASLSIITAILSAFMNNVGALALMMPIAIQTAIKSNRSPSLVLMPIAFASALGGLVTMIGTPPNLLISAYRQQVSGKQFTMFDFGHAGIFVAIAGIIFITFIGWRLIPGKRKSPKSAEDVFHIEDYIAEVKVPDESVVVGKTIKELDALLDVEYLLIGIIRNKRRRLSLPSDLIIEKGDIFIIESTPQNLERIVQKGKLEVVGSDTTGAEILSAHEIASMEVVVSPGSRLENRSSKGSRLKSRFGINLIAVAREGKPFRVRVSEVILRAGDVLLLQGSSESLSENTAALGLLPLVERNIQIGVKKKKWLPLFIFAIAIVLAALQWVPVQVAFGGAVVALIVFRTIPTRMIYDGIEWSVVILLAAMIPIGQALQTTGGTALITHFILSLAPHIAPIYIITILFIITMTLSDFMNNAATTVVMAPIAVSIAQSIHSNIDPFLMTVAIAASCSFLTPVGHQNNTIVMGPGGYKFTDYIRAGLPLEIVVIVVAIPTILWMWPI